MKRTIIFGDIHGCDDEWQDLLNKVGATHKDDLISVGDLVCKGPSTKKVLDRAMAMPNLRCVRGNHELHLLNRWKDKNWAKCKDYQLRALEELGEDLDRYMEYIESWPYYLDLPECLVIHAGLRPGIPLKKQDPIDMVHIRHVDPGFRPWYEDYKDEKLIVHGHWAAQGLVVRDNVIGLDSGCVYGRKLSAVILPSREIISVPAQKPYQPID